MTLEASFMKCQRLCSFQEHFPQKVGPVFKASFTHSHCIHVRIHSNNARFMQAGQRLSLLNIKEDNKWVNNACSVSCLGILLPPQKSTFSLTSETEKKFATLLCLHCYSLKLSIIPVLFTASSSSLASPSSPSLTTAHFELHGFVEYIFVYPVPGVFQEYACIIRQPLSKSHYSLISLVYLL